MGKNKCNCKHCKKVNQKGRGNEFYVKTKMEKIISAGTLQEVEKLNPAYRVRVFFIRHGQSCANLAKLFNVAPTHVLYRDPELTLNGINNSIKNGFKFREWLKKSGIELHYIGSSPLIRSMETAYYMFKDKNEPFFQENDPNFESKLIVCPFITELNLTPDNVPLSFDEQKNVLKLTMKNSYDNLTNNITNEAYRVEQRVRSSMSDFLEWLEKKVPELFKNYGRKQSEGFIAGDYENKLLPSDGTLNIAIVCHSGFINKYINNGTFSPYTQMYNNSVFVKNFLFQTQASQINYDANKDYPKDKEENCPNRCRHDPIQCERKIMRQ